MNEDNIIWRNQYRIFKWPAENPPLSEQIIVSDGGPWAAHNVVCAVCGERAAIFDLGPGVFLPCWPCQVIGWSLNYKPKRNFFKVLKQVIKEK